MYIVISCSVLALLLTYLESRGKMSNGMKWGFVLLTILGCIHYNYGNDYMGYYNIGKLVENTPFNLSNIMDGNIFREPGWVLLNYLFKPFGGFFVMVACLNILQNVIVYKFIKNEVDLQWWPLSIFIYLFSTSYYLLNFSMMRQGLVVSVFLGMWPWIRDKKWIRVVLVLLFCRLIHSSSIVLLPFAFWGYLPCKNVKALGISYFVLLIVLWIGGPAIESILPWALSIDDSLEHFSYYENEQTTWHLGFGLLCSLVPIVLSFLFLLKNNDGNEQHVRLVALCMLGILVAPFSRQMMLVGRIGIYFSIFSLASYPIIFNTINSKYKLFLLAPYIVYVVYNYYFFLSVDGWRVAYEHFHTIFETL